MLLWCVFTWPEDVRLALMQNYLSMPAGECGMLVGILPEMMKKCEELGVWVTHAFRYTDFMATHSAVNSDGSHSPQMSFLVTDLQERLEQVAADAEEATTQLLAVHVPGVRNTGADNLSRGKANIALFLKELAEGSELQPIEIRFPERAFNLMREVMQYPQGVRGSQ